MLEQIAELNWLAVLVAIDAAFYLVFILVPSIPLTLWR